MNFCDLKDSHVFNEKQSTIFIIEWMKKIHFEAEIFNDVVCNETEEVEFYT